MDLKSPNSDSPRVVIAETDHVVFKPSPIHGVGGFACMNIPAGTRILEYKGEKISKKESLTRCEGNNEYIFALDEEYDLDGNVSWNPARFLNHSCAPNCEAVLDEGQIWIVGIRNITAGEELTFNYGYELEDWREHTCCCGAIGCVGYVVAEEYFDYVRRQSGVERSSPLCGSEKPRT
jgi:SET domain-containing protein